MKAIETRYKGYRFRSRLEARWAVFFDDLALEWQYEPEGFILDDGTKYLPDFWLNNEKFVEIKPTAPTEEEKRKADGVGAIILSGVPGEEKVWPEGSTVPWNGNAAGAAAHARAARFEHGEGVELNILDTILADIDSGILPQYEINKEIGEALLLAENTNQSLLVIGGAGVGKSTFIDLFRRYSKKNVQVGAYTGTAAMNISGRTLHRIFGLQVMENYNSEDDEIRLTQEQIDYLSRIDTFVIDEISMVRIDLLVAIDMNLRNANSNYSVPFGGAQMIFVGDPYQIQPILKWNDRSTREFFEYKGYDNGRYKFFNRPKHGNWAFENIKVIELVKVYRQKEGTQFLDVLNRIRTVSMLPGDREYLNERVSTDPPSDIIRIVSKNKQAQEINQRSIEYLKKRSNSYTIPGKATGELAEKGVSYPTKDKDIVVVEGMRIIIITNSKEYVNGTQATIKHIHTKENGEVEYITVRLLSGTEIKLYRYTWDAQKNVWDKKTLQNYLEVVGTFTQFPIIPGYAITIHKSQGQTYHEGALVDLSGIFAFGQAYVALSRVPNHALLYLSSPITQSTVLRKQWSSELMMIQKFLEHKREENGETKRLHKPD